MTCLQGLRATLGHFIHMCLCAPECIHTYISVNEIEYENHFLLSFHCWSTPPTHFNCHAWQDKTYCFWVWAPSLSRLHILEVDIHFFCPKMNFQSFWNYSLSTLKMWVMLTAKVCKPGTSDMIKGKLLIFLLAINIYLHFNKNWEQWFNFLLSENFYLHCLELW